MHDGRFKTLEEVIDSYNKGGIKNRYLDKEIEPLKLKSLNPPEADKPFQGYKAGGG